MMEKQILINCRQRYQQHVALKSLKSTFLNSLHCILQSCLQNFPERIARIIQLLISTSKDCRCRIIPDFEDLTGLHNFHHHHTLSLELTCLLAVELAKQELLEMFYLNSTLNFGIPPVLVFQLEVYYKVDRLLKDLAAQQKGTTARWHSNKTR